MVPERTKLEMRYIYRRVYKRKVHGNLFLALNISLLKSDTFTFSMRCTERPFPYKLIVKTKLNAVESAKRCKECITFFFKASMTLTIYKNQY